MPGLRRFGEGFDRTSRDSRPQWRVWFRVVAPMIPFPRPFRKGREMDSAPSRQGAATVVCFCPPALHGVAARAGTLAPTLRRVDEEARATCLPLLLSEGFRLGFATPP